MRRPSSTTRRTWRLQRRWATGFGEGQAYGNLGIAYGSQGDFSKAIETGRTWRLQRRWAAGEVGAYGNLCHAYQSQGDLSQAIEYQTQDLAIAKEVGDHRRQPGATLPPHALDHSGTPIPTSDYAVQELGLRQ